MPNFIGVLGTVWIGILPGTESEGEIIEFGTLKLF